MTTENTEFKFYFWPKGIAIEENYTDCITLEPFEFVNKKNSQGDDDKKSLRVSARFQIILPIPNSIQFNDGISWNTEDLKAVGDQLKEIVNKEPKPTNVDALIKAGQGYLTQEILDQVSKMQVLGISRNAITQSLGKKILNPYTEQIFQGIGLRSFTFNWKLVPRDQDEQDEIYNIIKNLRVYSTPNISGASFDEVIFGQSPPNNGQESPADVQKLSDR